jgi:hypothetical protein
MARLKAAISAAGLYAGSFSTHSFRRGGALFAFQAGAFIHDSMARRLRRILNATIIAHPGATVQGLQHYLTAQSAPKLDKFGFVVLWIGTNNLRAPWDETRRPTSTFSTL